MFKYLECSSSIVSAIDPGPLALVHRGQEEEILGTLPEGFTHLADPAFQAPVSVAALAGRTGSLLTLRVARRALRASRRDGRAYSKNVAEGASK